MNVQYVHRNSLLLKTYFPIEMQQETNKEKSVVFFVVAEKLLFKRILEP